MADRARAFIRSTSAEQPLFCVASFFSPHVPFIVPQEFLDLYDRAALSLPLYPDEVERRRVVEGPTDDRLRAVRHGYYAAISEVDYYVGALLDELEETGRVGNTVVVVIADHGEWLGDQLRFGKGYPAADPISRVPLIVNWPAGLGRNGIVVDELVEALDVAPTLLSIAGIQAPPAMQGRDLRPLLRENPEGVRQIPGALTESGGWKTIRTRSHRYVIHEDGAERLWRLTDGPGECHDLSGDPGAAAELAECRHALLERLVSLERPIPPSWPY